jgi:hypothetical protein
MLIATSAVSQQRGLIARATLDEEGLQDADMGARGTKSRRRLAEASPVMSYAPRAAKRVTVDLKADVGRTE